MNVEINGYTDDGGPFTQRIDVGYPCTYCGETASRGRWCEHKETGRPRWFCESCLSDARKGEIA